jgi:hypothetical protein
LVLAALTAIRVILLWRWNEQVVVKNGGGGGRRDVGRLGKETWREENGDAMHVSSSSYDMHVSSSSCDMERGEWGRHACILLLI